MKNLSYWILSVATIVGISTALASSTEAAEDAKGPDSIAVTTQLPAPIVGSEEELTAPDVMETDGTEPEALLFRGQANSWSEAAVSLFCARPGDRCDPVGTIACCSGLCYMAGPDLGIAFCGEVPSRR
ncbi:MAG: hypothetical protein K0U98_17740 [Deltaproteobacteria bacterium]|nr:hypothetical protein [Deltaproteobacteria bacterium]